MSKALKAAIEANDPAAVKKALQTVKDLTRKLPGADAPLAYACRRGADAAIDPLLQAGALQWKGGYAGEHPFNIAAEGGHAGILEKLAAHPLPEEVVQHVLFSATLSGRAQAVRVILDQCRPAINHRMLETSTWWSDGVIFRMFLDRGIDVNLAHDGSQNFDQAGETPLHAAAGNGYLAPVRLLLDHGAAVDAVDQYGRTPLMHLADALARLDQEKRIREETQRRKAGKTPMMDVGTARRFGDREKGDPLDVARLLLERGADARRKDRFGNGLRMHYHWERLRDREPVNPRFEQLLQDAGPAGDQPMIDLIAALGADDLAAARKALKAGADPNRDTPPPVSATPLTLCRSAAMMEMLLDLGADANKPSLNKTPLIAAAGSGEMGMVKLLLRAGANIHALQPRAGKSEYVANAWSAADLNRKHEVAAYLKSLGAGNPVRPDWEPMKPGVVVWENFSEIIVKAPAHAVAAALATISKGTVRENVYGKELTPGTQAYAVLQPKGMAWSNVMRVTPPLLRFEPTDEKLLRELARESKAPVMLIEYGDAAGASSMKRFEPEGGMEQDQSGDEEALEEMVGAMGEESPGWAKKKLAKFQREKRPELDLQKLAQAEKFVIAWGSLPLGGKKTVEISFPNLPAEAFDATAWVST